MEHEKPALEVYEEETVHAERDSLNHDRKHKKRKERRMSGDGSVRQSSAHDLDDEPRTPSIPGLPMSPHKGKCRFLMFYRLRPLAIFSATVPLLTRPPPGVPPQQVFHQAMMIRPQMFSPMGAMAMMRPLMPMGAMGAMGAMGMGHLGAMGMGAMGMGGMGGMGAMSSMGMMPPMMMRPGMGMGGHMGMSRPHQIRRRPQVPGKGHSQSVLGQPQGPIQNSPPRQAAAGPREKEIVNTSPVALSVRVCGVGALSGVRLQCPAQRALFLSHVPVHFRVMLCDRSTPPTYTGFSQIGQ